MTCSLRSVLVLAGVPMVRGQRRVDTLVVGTIFGFEDLLGAHCVSEQSPMKVDERREG